MAMFFSAKPAPSAGFALRIVLAALLSILYSGFVPFLNNNIYHLPILRADYDLPQFADDAFVQSLRHFSSGFWQLLSGSGKILSPTLIMVAAFAISRVLMMAAALHFARSFGYRGARFELVFLVLLAVSPLMRGYAPGGGGLDIEYFSHSELANASLLFSLSLAIRGRAGPSIFLACITFFLNAFMAVWLAPLWLAVTIIRVRSGEESLSRTVRAAVPGMIAGFPPVAYVGWTILKAIEPGAPPAYSYAAYLRGFFPFHFFFDTLTSAELLFLSLCLMAILMCRKFLPHHARLYLAPGLAAAALLLAGSLVPAITENRFILNLHFIRSAVLLQMLAALGLAMVAAGLATRAGTGPARLCGYLIAGLLIIGKPALPAILLLLLYAGWLTNRFPLAFATRPLALTFGRGLVAAAIAWSVPGALVPAVENSRNLWAISGTWEELGRWAAANTPEKSVFLLPVGTEVPPAPTSPQSRNLAYDVAGFFATAGRSVWTSYKFGAAPMWSPSTYPEWHQRYGEVKRLDSAAERLVYANAHGISHVITFCDQALPVKPVHRSGDLCVYAAEP